MDETFNHPKFRSAGEFAFDLAKILKLTVRHGRAIRKMKGKFRESILLTVTLANNCRL